MTTTTGHTEPEVGGGLLPPPPPQTMMNSIFRGEMPDDVTQKYELLNVLGAGTFGIVRKCRHKESGEVFAVKTIQKSKVPDLNILKREIEILQEVDHPHIVKLYDVYENEKTIFLVTELCTGGELYDRVVEKTLSEEGHFSEYDAARITRNILEAIHYCHMHGIAHRDLKPENFLLKDDTDDAIVKIIDFGLSRFCTKDPMKSRVGTIYYVAPEVLCSTYTFKCDVWSIGIITYVLLCGYPPFNAGNERKTYALVQEGNVTFPSPAWDYISPEAIAFIKRLTTKDPETRPTAAEALTDPWIQQAEVQPKGIDRRASFIPQSSPQARQVSKERLVQHNDRPLANAFRGFMDRIKQRKKQAKTRAHQ